MPGASVRWLQDAAVVGAAAFAVVATYMAARLLALALMTRRRTTAVAAVSLLALAATLIYGAYRVAVVWNTADHAQWIAGGIMGICAAAVLFWLGTQNRLRHEQEKQAGHAGISSLRALCTLIVLALLALVVARLWRPR